MNLASIYHILWLSVVISVACGQLPIVINTWGWTQATDTGFKAISGGGSALDAVEAGCTRCEVDQCDGTVGFGGSPDESSETTLDALIMDGNTMDSGAVGNLRRIKQAISVARYVLTYTTHTMLAGDQATAFAISNGFVQTNLSTDSSIQSWQSWVKGNCQPNYRMNTIPAANVSCGPYSPAPTVSIPKSLTLSQRAIAASNSDKNNHDTISMIAIGVVNGKRLSAAGTSTNGASHKVPGRVGDGPITGSGSYVDDNVGGCGATGDGDIMMRFLPCYQAVESMRQGQSPQAAANDAIARIVKYYPNVHAAIVVVSNTGIHAGAAYGWTFQYSYRQGNMNQSVVVSVPPIDFTVAL